MQAFLGGWNIFWYWQLKKWLAI